MTFHLSVESSRVQLVMTNVQVVRHSRGLSTMRCTFDEAGDVALPSCKTPSLSVELVERRTVLLVLRMKLLRMKSLSSMSLLCLMITDLVLVTKCSTWLPVVLAASSSPALAQEKSSVGNFSSPR